MDTDKFEVDTLSFESVVFYIEQAVKELKALASALKSMQQVTDIAGWKFYGQAICGENELSNENFRLREALHRATYGIDEVEDIGDIRVRIEYREAKHEKNEPPF